VLPAVLLAVLLAACVARPSSPPPPPGNPWADALQACDLADDALTLTLTTGQQAEALCTRARALGDGLHCLGRQMPALPAAQARFTAVGLLEFQGCLQPLAEGLMAGRLGRPREIDLALRQCVLQLDHAPVGPPPRLAWWHGSAGVRWPPLPADEPALALARLPAAAALSWPACDDVDKLALPLPAAPAAATAAAAAAAATRPKPPASPASPEPGRSATSGAPARAPALLPAALN
jgi:hypothetical protein